MLPIDFPCGSSRFQTSNTNTWEHPEHARKWENDKKKHIFYESQKNSITESKHLLKIYKLMCYSCQSRNRIQETRYIDKKDSKSLVYFTEKYRLSTSYFSLISHQLESIVFKIDHGRSETQFLQNLRINADCSSSRVIRLLYVICWSNLTIRMQKLRRMKRQNHKSLRKTR